MKSREGCQIFYEGNDVVRWKASTVLIHFLPDFLMPWLPVLRGPFLPLAASCMSFLAWASEEDQYTLGVMYRAKKETNLFSASL